MKGSDFHFRGERNSVLMIGAFPPPLHGMSAVNKAMSKLLFQKGIDVHIVNTAAGSLKRSVVSRLRRIPRIISALCYIVLWPSTPGDSLYMNVSGGSGQVYEIFFVLFARIKNLRIFLHHHCYSYINRKSVITRILMSTAGTDCTHIVLSRNMRAELMKVYGMKASTIALSNVVFVPERNNCAKRREVDTVGFLGNVSKDKGIYDFLNLVEACNSEGVYISGIVAGPFQDIETETEVRVRIAEIENVDYVGPVYDIEKWKFFDSIDVLIFPTQYANEAQPLTILEALQSAVPVIAFGRGSIPEMIDNSFGVVVPISSSFIDKAIHQIRKWKSSSASMEAASEAAEEAFMVGLTENLSVLHRLVELMSRGHDENR